VRCGVKLWSSNSVATLRFILQKFNKNFEGIYIYRHRSKY